MGNSIKNILISGIYIFVLTACTSEDVAPNDELIPELSIDGISNGRH